MLRVSLNCVGIVAVSLAIGPALCAAQLNDVTVHHPYLVAQLNDTNQDGTTEEPDSLDGVDGTAEPETPGPTETTEPAAPPPAEPTPYPAPEEPGVTSPTEPGPPAQPGVPAPTEPTAPGVTPPEPMTEPEPVGAGPTPEAQEPVGAGPDEWQDPYFGEERAALPRAGTGAGWMTLLGAGLTTLGVAMRRRRR